MLAGHKRGPCHRTQGQARNIIIVIAVEIAIAVVVSDSDSGLWLLSRARRAASAHSCWLDFEHVRMRQVSRTSEDGGSGKN